MRPTSAGFDQRPTRPSHLHITLLLLLLLGLASLADSRRRHPRSVEAQEAANGTDMIVHEREFVSPLVRVQMDCKRDKTSLALNFTKPFSGIISIGRLPATKCRIDGDGSKAYQISVNHNATECEAQWDNAHSSIFNTLYVRFHPSLETGSDIAKNVMCRLAVGDLVVGRRPSRPRPQAAQRLKQNQQVAPGGSSDLEVAFYGPTLIIPQV